MKRFLWFCLGLVIMTALLVNTGCVTVQKERFLLMDMLEEELENEGQREAERKVGWTVIDEDGYHWEYRVLARWDNIQVLAVCEYTYMKVSGVEKWRGTYYGTPTDFYWKDPPVSRVDNLSGCFDWVNHHMNGDHFI